MYIPKYQRLYETYFVLHDPIYITTHIYILLVYPNLSIIHIFAERLSARHLILQQVLGQYIYIYIYIYVYLSVMLFYAVYLSITLFYACAGGAGGCVKLRVGHHARQPNAWAFAGNSEKSYSAHSIYHPHAIILLTARGLLCALCVYLVYTCHM